jgi:hypothetical protein
MKEVTLKKGKNESVELEQVTQTEFKERMKELNTQ